MTDADIVERYVAADLSEAEEIQAILHNEGVQASIVGEPLQGLRGGPLPTGWNTSPRIRVSSADYQRGREIIATWELDRRTPKPARSLGDWTCSHCGEKVPGDFDVCWNCGSSKMAS